ncbi:MAG: glutathione S-transferase family protein [Pseudomonadales bacterium]
MGLLVDGNWVDTWYDTESTGGRFQRQQQAFRNWVTADGSPGPTGSGGFPAEWGRYHLYVSYACPWAQRTLIMRAFKGLEEHIRVSMVHWHMGDHGWTFEPAPGVIPDPLFAVKYLYELYLKADPKFTGRVTVPVLWDSRQNTIVSNESADIIRMLNSAFNAAGAEPGDFYPTELRDQIDQINDRVYHTLNNGVYKCGFATTQEAYDEAVYPLFDTLNWLEGLLAKRRYLTGNSLTEADVRLVTTLLRFDPVYHGHFKCNIRRLVDYPNLWGYTRELYQHPRIRHTVDFHHIRHHYYGSHPNVNPSGVIPAGPELDYAAPHGRS